MLFVLYQAIDIVYAAIGSWRAGKLRLAVWAPSLMLYFPLATLAVYRALWELGRSPFRWDKTTHGIDKPMPNGGEAEPARLPGLPGDPEGRRARRAVTPPPEPLRRRAGGGS